MTYASQFHYFFYIHFLEQKEYLGVKSIFPTRSSRKEEREREGKKNERNFMREARKDRKKESQKEAMGKTDEKEIKE